MDELKAMTTAIMDSLIEMTKRAVTAENLEAALHANIDKARDDANYWKDAYHRVDKRLEAALAELEALKSADAKKVANTIKKEIDDYKPHIWGAKP